MTMIASRTPEGFPSKCPVCGAATEIEFSDPGDDAPCPCCGHLLLRSLAVFERIRELFTTTLGINPERITVDTRLSEFVDSLDIVELVMELEEEGVLPGGQSIDAEDAAKAETFGDLVRSILERERRDDV